MEVYLSRARVREFRRWWVPGESLLEKMERLFHAAGLDGLVEKGSRVGIKLHMGEPGHVHYMRPVYAWKLVDILKNLGAETVVVETCGLGTIPGRTSASKHMEAARRNGFTEETMGAPLLIADGEEGLDMVYVDGIPVAEGIVGLDSLMVLSHATGHIQAGFGGALKNLALGCVAKPGKFRVHHEGRPRIDADACDSCGECIAVCPADAIASEPVRITEDCILCGGCADACPEGAIKAEIASAKTLSKRIAENAAGVVKALNGHLGYLTLMMDILPHCDCHPHSDIPVVPDIGILASRDPVGIDMAAVDLINTAPGLPGSEAEALGTLEGEVDILTKLNPNTRWAIQMEEAERLGLGRMEYELAEVR
ncbi:MAG: DUF362 domain-containing protein [Candidatus Hydrothermarchaeaceae archaeon]